MALYMSFSFLIFASTSVSDDMTFCVAWAGVLVEWPFSLVWGCFESEGYL